MRLKHYMNEAKARKSLFDSSISVIIVSKNDTEYIIWRPKFKEYGHAIGVPDRKVIVWDGETIKKLNKHEIMFVEAHEFSHFKLGENASEADCDWLAIVNLWKKGKKIAAKIGVDDFKKRNGFDFDTSSLKGYK